MYNDDDEEIFMTAKEEEEAILAAEKEKAEIPARQEFEKIINSYYDIECLSKILLKALKNEFESPTVDEVECYFTFLLKQLYNHKMLLDNFTKQLPERKAKLISLSYAKFKD